MTTITTSTAATATAYSNQRKIDRTQNGVLWAMFWDGSTGTGTPMHLRYSTDNGATWTDGGGFGFVNTGTTYTPNGSLFIDLDDYAHVVYKDRSDGGIYYRRGTPNAARTAYTWSAANSVWPSGTADYPDLVAHRQGTGWQVHILVSSATDTTTKVTSWEVNVSSSGTIGTPSGAGIVTTPYGNTAHAYPSIDFNHTGDGKTVAGGTPHLYAAWSAGVTGTGKGIRFKKATYSGGSWSWGIEREIDSTSYANAGRISSAFDGTRVIIAYADSQATSSIKVRERDAADTTTTTRTPTALNDGTVTGLSVSYDGGGDLRLAAIGATSGDPKHLAFTRSTAVWGSSWVTLAAATAQSDTLSLQRSHGGGRIGVLYTDGAASPFGVTYAAIILNTPPNAPTLTGPANNSMIDRTITQRFSWLFSDPDAGDAQSKFDLQWWALDAPAGNRVGPATTVSQTIPNQFYDFAANYWAAGNFEWQVRTYDSQGVVGPWSSSFFFAAATAPTPPTITAPTSGGTISSGTATVTWSEPNQDSYQIRRVADNAGAADTSTVYYDSGEVVDSTSRSATLTFDTNNRWEHIQVRVKYGGLWSSWSDIRVDVSYTPPPAPTVALTPDSAGGTVTVAITNPAPGTGQPAVSYNDVYQRSPAATPNADPYLPYSDTGTRVATSLATNTTYTDPWPASGVAYEYQVVAVASNGTTSASGWVSL